MARLTALTLGIDDAAVASDHVARTIRVELGDGSLIISCARVFVNRRYTNSKTPESKGDPVGESSDGTLCQVLDDVGNRVLLGGQELVDFLKSATMSALFQEKWSSGQTIWL